MLQSLARSSSRLLVGATRYARTGILANRVQLMTMTRPTAVRCFMSTTTPEGLGDHWGKASDEYHRHSTRHRAMTREVLQKLDVPVEFIHYKPITFSDKVAHFMVKALRNVSKLFYRQKYTHYACTLETVAAVPGMVAGMIQHLRALRNMEPNFWIKTLLDEAENERMHLMAFIQLTNPTLAERLFVLSAQGVYFTAFTFFYVVSKRTAHRFTGYLEEEAVKSYTEMLADIDAKKVPNPPAPQIALDYWNLPADATLRDMVLVVRADEMDHRDTNHLFSSELDRNKHAPTEPIAVSLNDKA